MLRKLWYHIRRRWRRRKARIRYRELVRRMNLKERAAGFGVVNGDLQDED